MSRNLENRGIAFDSLLLPSLRLDAPQTSQSSLTSYRRARARRNADFPPCRGNREIERKERSREKERERDRDAAQSTTRVPMWNQAKREKY